MLSLILLAILVVILSACSSMSEAAILSVSEVEIEKQAQESPNNSSVLALKKLYGNITHTISVLVILNNIANIAGSLAVGALAAKHLDSFGQGVFSAILTFVIIIWAEIIPKTIGERYDIHVCMIIALPLSFLSKILGWLANVLNFIAKFFVPNHQVSHTTDEAEIAMLAKIGGDEGAIDKEESEMIQRVFALDDTKAKDIMTPRVKMFYLEIDKILKDVKQEIIDSSYSRIVLVCDGPDDIKGVAYKNELLSALVENKGQQRLEKYIHKVRFVPEQAPADRLLKDFQSHCQHIVIVVDEFGGVEGIVSLEDVLEVITGEIVDENDSVVDLQQSARIERENK